MDWLCIAYGVVVVLAWGFFIGTDEGIDTVTFWAAVIWPLTGLLLAGWLIGNALRERTS